MTDLKNKNEEFWYTESQGEREDSRIIKRYSEILDYFEKNPDRTTAPNMRKLSMIYNNDKVLENNREFDIEFGERLIGILYPSEKPNSEQPKNTGELTRKINKKLIRKFARGQKVKCS